MKESQIQRAILDYLAATGVMAFRMNTGAVKAEYNGRTRFMRFGVPGMADLVAFPAGRVCWIECKSETGRQSPEQRSFQDQVQRHGHRYTLCRSVDDVIAALGDCTGTASEACRSL